MTALLALLLAVRLPTPTMSPAAGTYTSTQSVTVSSSAAGDTIYCTTDGTAPRRAASQRVSGPISVASTATVRCRAYALDGREPSRATSATYTISAPQPLVGWAASCAAEAEPTTNIIYACDCQTGAASGCVAGNDANAGTSKSAPVQSWSKVAEKFRGLPAGGTVALCKGGMWNGDQDTGGLLGWKNNNCTPSSPCTVRDYQASWGGSARPQVSVSLAEKHGMTFWGNATDYSAAIRVLNLRFFRPDGGATVASGTSAGIRGTDNAANVEVCNCELDGFGWALYTGDTGAHCRTANWRIRGNRILNSCTDAMLVSFKDTVVDGNYFDNNGHALCGSYVLPFGPSTHTIYIDGRQCPTENIQIINNQFYRSSVYNGDGYGVWYPGYYSQGAALSVGVYAYGVLYENNLIDWRPYHPSLPMNTFVGGGGLDNVTLRRNRVYMGSGSFARFDSSTHALVEDNIIHVGAPFATGDIIYVPQPGAGASAAVVRNNTIYVEPGSATVANVIHATDNAAASPTVITGNSITFAGSPGTSCFRVPQSSMVQAMDNNQCSGATNWATTDGSAFYSLAAWRAAHPTFDANSTTAAASFANAPADLTPAPGDTTLAGKASAATTCTVLGVANQPCTSPIAIDSPTWSPTATAKTRTGAPFDIGAMER